MRKERKGGRPTKHLDVLSSKASPSSVRSRSAFIIAKRAKELGLDKQGIADAIGCSVQYARNLMGGTAIPSDDTIQAIIEGLDPGQSQSRTSRRRSQRKTDGGMTVDITLGPELSGRC